MFGRSLAPIAGIDYNPFLSNGLETKGWERWHRIVLYQNDKDNLIGVIKKIRGEEKSTECRVHECLSAEEKNETKEKRNKDKSRKKKKKRKGKEKSAFLLSSAFNTV